MQATQPKAGDTMATEVAPRWQAEGTTLVSPVSTGIDENLHRYEERQRSVVTPQEPLVSHREWSVTYRPVDVVPINRSRDWDQILQIGALIGTALLVGLIAFFTVYLMSD